MSKPTWPLRGWRRSLSRVADEPPAPNPRSGKFRLPRIARFGWWAPVISTTLFAMYHLDQPWSVASVFVGFLPIALLTYWKRNVYLAVISHALVNLIAQCLWMLPFLWQ